MSLSLEKMRELTELSMLETDDLQRIRFMALLPAVTEDEREYWKALEQENRVLRTLVGGGSAIPHIPNLLEAALLTIPTTAPTPAKTSWRQTSIPWPVAAGIIIAMFGIAWYLYQAGDRPAYQMASFPPAPKAVMEKVESLAVTDHLAAPPLEVQGNIPAAVATALQAENAGRIPFGIVMPNVGIDCHLLGGSILPFGNGFAVYTRWNRQGATFSLYQFLPENMGLPHQYSKEVASPVTSSGKSKEIFATVWSDSPDGKTSWAVVWDSTTLGEPFSRCD